MWRRMMPRSSPCASTPDTEQRVGRLINGRRGPAPRGSQAPSMPSRRAIDSATVPRGIAAVTRRWGSHPPHLEPIRRPVSSATLLVKLTPGPLA